MVQPIGAHQVLILLLQLGVLLSIALLLGRLALRMGMPPVVGELTAGVLLGPSVLAHLAPALSGWLLPRQAEQLHLLDAVGQLGVLLLVGLAGMHIDLGMIRRKGATAAWVGAGALLVPLALGIGTGLLLPGSMLGPNGDRGVFVLFVGVAMCVSAIPVIAKTLLEMRLLHRDVGQLVMSAAALDDIVGWLLLSVVSALAVGGLHPVSTLRPVGALLVVLAIAALVGRPIVRAVLTLAGRSDPGVTVAAVTALLLLSSAGTQALGLEAILGAFLCGILIGSAGASGGFDRARLLPMRTFVMSVLAPIFFATAGLRMDLTALRHPVVLASALSVLAVAVGGKFAGAYLGARIGRLGHWEGLALGAGLNARGIVEVIVALVGLRLGVLSAQTYTIVVLVAVATSLMAPPTLRFAMRRIAVTHQELQREKEGLLT
jgi:Kef-type K+ transport system membrane component KefB